MVSVLPLTIAGPEITLKVTGSPELAVAESMIGVTPKVTGLGGAVKEMVCVACSTLNALLIVLMLIAEVNGAGGEEDVIGSVATSVSLMPSALTCEVPEPAIPEAFVLSELTLRDPGLPKA